MLDTCKNLDRLPAAYEKPTLNIVTQRIKNTCAELTAVREGRSSCVNVIDLGSRCIGEEGRPPNDEVVGLAM